MFTVAALKRKLQQMQLSTAGNKAELILRMNQADPSGQWITDIDTDARATVEEQEDSRDATASRDTEPDERVPERQSELARDREREAELTRRERDLMLRELEFMRRENEHLRATMQATSGNNTSLTASKVSLSNLKEMLLSFDGRKGYFQRWKEQLKLVKHMYQLDDNMTKLLLGAKLTGDAAEWFHSVPAHLSMTVGELLERMEAMYDQREKKLTLRKEFEARMWQPNETFADYFHKKIILANKVPISEDEIVDYLIEGIPAKSIKYHAMMQRFSNKETLLRAMENISLNPDHKTPLKTERTAGNKYAAKTTGSARKTEGDLSEKTEPRCYNCNQAGHLASKCPMPKREKGACFKCFQMGHKARECSSRGQAKSESSKGEAEKKTDVNSMFSGGLGDFHRKVDYQMSDETKDFVVNLKLDTLLDTGSPVSFAKDNLVPPKLILPVSKEDNRYRGINDSLLEVRGRVIVQLSLNDKEPKSVSLLVVPAQSMKASVVIGRDVLKQFYEERESTDEALEDRVIKEILNIHVDERCKESCDALNINRNISLEAQNAVKEVFVEEYVKPERPDQPLVDAELKLKLKNDEPFRFSLNRPSYAERKELRVLLDSLLEKKIIRPSESEYASPIVLVRKKTGDLRLCIDYRALNKLLVGDNYPLPNIEDLIDSLCGKKYFSKLDLKNGFYHIRVSDESIKYTAFATPFGQYEFTRMPFGLKVAPSRFQRYINQVLSELIREIKVVVYMDDILVMSVTIEQHIEVLRQIFRLFVANKLELRIDKCAFLQTEIEFVGYLISGAGISPTKEGIKSVQRIPVPRNVKEVHSFVALCSYFRKFIPSFSLIAKPLYELLRKNVTFAFGERELQAFEELKRKLIQPPVLAIYNPNSETELHCDASTAGFGAVLAQRGIDKQFHPIFFFSKRTTETESRYHSFELEMLAIIYALRRFKVYLSGIKFKIVTDCNALTLAIKKKDISPRISRWILELLEYDYVTEHRPGTKMGHVDALSRLPSEVLVIEDNSFELNLALSQDRDTTIRELKELLQKTEDPYFELRNGIVFRKHNGELLFYVPRVMETHVLHRYHDQMGHFAVERTYDNIIKSYWFPHMRQKIRDHVSNCLKCIAFSPSEGKRQGYLHCIPKGQVPFEVYHIDHYGPVDKDRLAKRYLLVVIDAFTKFVKLYPTKTTATQEVISHLQVHFSNYSRPRVIISDRGTAFTSSEFESFCEENNVQHVKSATHSPQANGQVERTNRVLGPMISKLIDNDEKVYWYKVIADIEFAINNTMHKTTKETPSKLLFGVEQRGKIVDAIREHLETSISESDRDLERLRARAANRIEQSQKYNKEYFDRRRKPAHSYKIGDYVMIKNIETAKGASHKIIPKFKGPYEVMRVLRNDRYVIKDVNNHQLTQKPYAGTWAAANMKPWVKGSVFEGEEESGMAECRM